MFLEKTAHGIELAQIQQRIVKLEYFTLSSCLVRDLASHLARVEMLAFSTAGSSPSRPATSDEICSKELGS
jgi:hypothetical protein